MKIHEIVTYGHPALETKAETIEEITEEIKALADDLVYTLYSTDNGVGLAAPQIGVTKRMLVIDLDHNNADGEPIVVLNPEILEYSEEKDSYEEGCLSFPEITGEITRPISIKLKWMDIEGKTHEDEFDGFVARVFQHEIDHTNGIVFINRMGKLRRTTLAPKLRKLRKKTKAELGI